MTSRLTLLTRQDDRLMITVHLMADTHVWPETHQAYCHKLSISCHKTETLGLHSLVETSTSCAIAVIKKSPKLSMLWQHKRMGFMSARVPTNPTSLCVRLVVSCAHTCYKIRDYHTDRDGLILLINPPIPSIPSKYFHYRPTTSLQQLQAPSHQHQPT